MFSMAPAPFPLAFGGHSSQFFRSSKGRSDDSPDEGTSRGV
jgi:hypothetical protein